MTHDSVSRKTVSKTSDGDLIALVMQGGGALGAYEWGIVDRLCEEGYQPVAITGVSIGAINAAAIAGAGQRSIRDNLKALWETIAVDPPWLLPSPAVPYWSALNNPNFYKPRTDLFNFHSWSSLCDVSPMRDTLNRICNFEQISDFTHMLFGVTATDVGNGQSVRFLNTKQAISADHILASGALAPSFPMVEIEGRAYWDGGLFDNTPMRPMIDLLAGAGLFDVPMIVVDLFPSDSKSEAFPRNLRDVHARISELAYENRFWDDFGGPDALSDIARTMSTITDLIPANHPVRATEAFRLLLDFRCLGNLHVIPTPHELMTGGMDFSRATLYRRFEIGRAAAASCLPARSGQSSPSLCDGPVQRRRVMEQSLQ